MAQRYGRHEVLRELDLSVASGEIYGLLGLNGAGKTTALRLLLGMMRPDAGEVRLLGRTARDAEVRRQVGVLFEDYAAYPYLTGRQQLRAVARLHGVSGTELRQAVEFWLDRVGLGGAANERVRRYSLGMVRRLGIAAALVHSPRVVFFDEPTNGLDPQGIQELRELVLALNRESQTTFFISSHILSEVEKVCDRVGILHCARVVREGTIAELTGVPRATSGGKGARPRRYSLRVDDTAAVRGIVESMEGVELLASEPIAPGPDTRRGVELILTLPETAAPELVRRLVSAGASIYALTLRERSLEDVFRAVVTAEASAPSGGDVTPASRGST